MVLASLKQDNKGPFSTETARLTCNDVELKSDTW